MHSVAFAPPVRVATLRSLRRLARMAVTALVLVVGLNGLTAPVPGDPLRPVATVRPPAGLRVAPAMVDAPTRTATTAAGVAGADTADSPTRHPRVGSTAPATGVPARHIGFASAAARMVAAVAAPADPGPGSVTRRGPPRA